jgi:hypothetical protein
MPLFINDNLSVRVNDTALPSDASPTMIENRAPTNGHYSWEAAFMYVPPGIFVTFNTTLMGTPNLSGTGCQIHAPTTISRAFYDVNPTNWASDGHALDNSANTFGQSFVATGNRVVAAKFQTTIGALADLRYSVRIREGGPSGNLIGQPGVSRWMKSDEFFTQNVRWPLLGQFSVPVVPGQTYYAEIARADQVGLINIWARNSNVYPGGQMFRNGQAEPGKDLMGHVVCATVIDQPIIKTSTGNLAHTVDACTALNAQSFTVKNNGPDILSYSLASNQPWALVFPLQGTSSGEEDTIQVYLKPAGLAAGVHNATVTVSSENASNSPQAVNLQLTINTRTAPGDLDSDCDVDQTDFGKFQSCLTGPNDAQSDPACLAARLDADADVDAGDFSIFQACMSGQGVPADPDCGP